MAGPTGQRPEPTDASVGGLTSEVAKDLSALVRQEVALAKAELGREARTAGQAAGMFGGAGFAGYFVLVFVSLAAMWGLDEVLPLGWAALIIAACWAVVAGVLALLGRRRMSEVNPKPERTIETVKEDVRWAKTRSS
jgi:Putative Actinobacterial Holin-X, holin superfamily III